MSEGNKRLCGSALKKAKRLEKLANLGDIFSNRETNESRMSVISDVPSTVSELPIENRDDKSIFNLNTKNDSLTTNLPLITETKSDVSDKFIVKGADNSHKHIDTQKSSEGSDFYGFSPQNEFKNYARSMTHASRKPSEESDFLGFSPQNEIKNYARTKKHTTRKSSEGSDFLGFSPQNEFINYVRLPILKESEDYLGFTPLRASTPKRKSADLPMPHTLSTRNSFDFSLLSRNQSDFFADTPLSRDSFDYKSFQTSESNADESSTSFESELTDTFQFFVKHQFFAGCEYDYLESLHECCCMSMVALLYSVHKIIYDWDASDLEVILDLGHEYFNESLAYRQQSLQRSVDSYLKPYELVPLINIFNKCYDVDVGNFEYFGPLDEQHLLLGFNFLDEIGCNLAILEINSLSYGLVLCRFSTAVEYVFFDCHGRTLDGDRFGEYCSTLFFTDVLSIVSLLCKEFHDVARFHMHAVNFRFAFDIKERPGKGISSKETTIIEMTSPLQQPINLVKDIPLLPGQYFYKKVFGTFNQFSQIFPEPHHQCTAMSAVALANNSIKSVHNWNTADLDAILLAGQQYYELNMNHIDLQNPNAVTVETYLEAIALTPYLEFGDLSFTVNVCYGDLGGGFHEERHILSNAIADFEKKKIVTAVITYRTYSYGLIRCARGNSASSYVFFDSHGRDYNGRRPGALSAILFFNNAEDFIPFFITKSKCGK